MSNTPYRLLSLTISNETGFNGPYKKATGVFEDTSRPGGTITVVIVPKPIAAHSPNLVANINENVKRGRHARFIVKAINTRPRLDGKGSNDVVDFIFEYFPSIHTNAMHVVQFPIIS